MNVTTLSFLCLKFYLIFSACTGIYSKSRLACSIALFLNDKSRVLLFRVFSCLLHQFQLRKTPWEMWWSKNLFSEIYQKRQRERKIKKIRIRKFRFSWKCKYSQRKYYPFGKFPSIFHRITLLLHYLYA